MFLDKNSICFFHETSSNRICFTLIIYYIVLSLDPFPTVGETKSLTACEVGFSDNCGRRYEIDIKNCTSFLVYKLKPLDVCNSAYCFGIYWLNIA